MKVDVGTTLSKIAFKKWQISGLVSSCSDLCNDLSLCEKPLSKQQGRLCSKDRAHSLRTSCPASGKASGQRRQGYCCHGKINLRTSCPAITMIAFLTIRRRAWGHSASGPNHQTSKDNLCSGSASTPSKSFRLAQAGFSSKQQNVPSKWIGLWRSRSGLSENQVAFLNNLPCNFMAPWASWHQSKLIQRDCGSDRTWVARMLRRLAKILHLRASFIGTASLSSSLLLRSEASSRNSPNSSLNMRAKNPLWKSPSKEMRATVGATFVHLFIAGKGIGFRTCSSMSFCPFSKESALLAQQPGWQTCKGGPVRDNKTWGKKQK